MHFALSMLQFIQKIFGKKEKEIKEEKETKEEQKKEEHFFDLSPEQFQTLLQENKNIKLIDVRRPEEYKEGHIQGSVLLPVQELSQEKLDAASVKKDDAILLYCRSGGRSGHALHMMQQFGYKNVKHLDGGILAWKEKNLPVEK